LRPHLQGVAVGAGGVSVGDGCDGGSGGGGGDGGGGGGGGARARHGRHNAGGSPADHAVKE